MRSLPLVLVGCAISAMTGCTAASPAQSATAQPSPRPSVATSAAASSERPATAPTELGDKASCPASYAQPDPQRPRLSASVSVAGSVVTGTERIVFTPDRAVSDIVFRLWAAAPRPAAYGGGIRVTSARVDGSPRIARRPSPTVLRIPARLAAGRRVTVDVGFRLRLPTGLNDRLGHSGTTSWFGSGLPLFAWERGHGWALEPPTSAFAEASTSEAMELTSLAVTRRRGLSVIGPGQQVADDGRTATFRARSIRDVAVAVGAFRTARLGRNSAGTTVSVGVAPGLPDGAATVAGELARAARVHAARFGPFPYEGLSVAVLPDLVGGIEYPGVILLGSRQLHDATASHEVAHQWFYGLVGNNQGRDPWLDEAFATYAEAVDRGSTAEYLRTTIPAEGRGHAGSPMSYWQGRTSSYYRSVYLQGAQGLLRGRAAVGAAAFDRAMACYVRRNAHAIATPADLAASFRDLPAVLRELHAVGAL